MMKSAQRTHYNITFLLRAAVDAVPEGSGLRTQCAGDSRRGKDAMPSCGASSADATVPQLTGLVCGSYRRVLTQLCSRMIAHRLLAPHG